MAWSSEDSEVVSSGNKTTKVITLGDNQRAHVQVVRSGATAPAPIDVRPLTSTDPARAARPWDDKPYRPWRILGGDFAGSGVIEGPAHVCIELIDPLGSYPFTATVYWKISGSA